MGTDNLYWKRKIELARKRELRFERESILIVCEGKKTEPNYFKALYKALRATSVDVKVIGKGSSTKSLIESTKRIADAADVNDEKYDQIWCVFDKDSFTKEQFNTAIQMAESYGVYAAYSNEAFELWYLLHFEYLTAAITRKQYCKKLEKYLGRKYKKNDTSIYESLERYQSKAIKNAARLLESQSDQKPADANPSTKVHLLVLELNRYKK